jgi:hypothetical protein
LVELTVVILPVVAVRSAVDTNAELTILVELTVVILPVVEPKTPIVPLVPLTVVAVIIPVRLMLLVAVLPTANTSAKSIDDSARDIMLAIV